MSTESLLKENAALLNDLENAQDRIFALEFERRTWKSGFWIMNLIMVCHIAFHIASVHG